MAWTTDGTASEVPASCGHSPYRAECRCPSRVGAPVRRDRSRTGPDGGQRLYSRRRRASGWCCCSARRRGAQYQRDRPTRPRGAGGADQTGAAARARRASSAVGRSHPCRDAMVATEGLDSAGLEARAQARGAVASGRTRSSMTVAALFLHTVGDRWHRGSITPAHEHLAHADGPARAGVGRRRVRRARGRAAHRRRDARRRSYHELGAMLVAAAAAGEGMARRCTSARTCRRRYRRGGDSRCGRALSR